MGSKEIRVALEKVIENETRTDHGEFTLEFCRIDRGQHQHLTSAVLANSRSNQTDVMLEDIDDEMSFSRFLGSDFVCQPFVLVSKVRKPSVADDSLKQSSPMNAINNEIITLKTRIESVSLKQDSSGIWGSPLKCNFPTEDESLDLASLDSSQAIQATKKKRPKHLGIPLNFARKYISAFNTDSGKTDSSLLVLCDGGDLHSTAMLGVKRFQVPTNADARKVLKTVMVTVDEKGSVDKWNQRIRLGAGLSQSFHAVYQVSAGNADAEKPWGTVAVEIKWKGANRLLENPPAEASTAVKASVQSGNMQSSMNPYHQELQFLWSIVTAVTTGQVEWQSSATDRPTLPLTAAVQSLIQTLQEEGSLGSMAAQGDGSTDSWSFGSALKTFTIPERKDYDFTDRLWKVLLDCMSTADLVASLRIIFRALGQGQLRPFVDRHNQTTVAQMVRESFTGRFSCPSLTGIQPFLFLAEMGAEKLRRDYIQIFLSQNLASTSALEAFISTQGELAAKLEDLGKLHSVLEMVALLKTSLHLPMDTLGVTARHMLAHYRQHPVNPQHVFSFPVKTSEVRYIISSVQPVMWCVETTNQVSEGVQESMLHCLTATQPFLHFHARPRGMSASKGDNGEKMDNGVELSPVDDSSDQYCLVQRKESVMFM